MSQNQAGRIIGSNEHHETIEARLASLAQSNAALSERLSQLEARVFALVSSAGDLGSPGAPVRDLDAPAAQAVAAATSATP